MLLSLLYEAKEIAGRQSSYSEQPRVGAQPPEAIMIGPHVVLTNENGVGYPVQELEDWQRTPQGVDTKCRLLQLAVLSIEYEVGLLCCVQYIGGNVCMAEIIVALIFLMRLVALLPQRLRL